MENSGSVLVLKGQFSSKILKSLKKTLPVNFSSKNHQIRLALATNRKNKFQSKFSHCHKLSESTKAHINAAPNDKPNNGREKFNHENQRFRHFDAN